MRPVKTGASWRHPVSSAPDGSNSKNTLSPLRSVWFFSVSSRHGRIAGNQIPQAVKPFRRQNKTWRVQSVSGGYRKLMWQLVSQGLIVKHSFQISEVLVNICLVRFGQQEDKSWSKNTGCVIHDVLCLTFEGSKEKKKHICGLCFHRRDAEHSINALSFHIRQHWYVT